MRVVHDPNLNQIQRQAENVWKSFLDLLKVLKDAAKSPNALLDHLRIVFADESNLSNDF